MINLPTKFEVPNFMCHGNMKGVAKCRKRGDLGWLGARKLIGNVTIRYSAYDFLFVFNRNYTCILYRL